MEILQLTLEYFKVYWTISLQKNNISHAIREMSNRNIKNM